MGDYHVRFRERLRVKLPLSTRPKWMCKYQKNNIQKCCMNFVKMSGIDITVYKYPPRGGLWKRPDLLYSNCVWTMVFKQTIWPVRHKEEINWDNQCC